MPTRQKIIAFFLVLIIFSGCQTRTDTTYNKLKSYIDKIKIVDTHEHHFSNAEYTSTSREYDFFEDMFYFKCDMISAGLSTKVDMKKTVDELWGTVGKYYNYGRATSYHAQVIYGFKKLYGFDKLFLTKEDAIELEKRVRANYQNYYNKWLDSAFKMCNFEIMFADNYWDQYNVDYDSVHFALVFRVDDLVADVAKAAVNKKITNPSLLKVLNKSNPIHVNTLDDYIAVVDSAFKINLAHNTVALKVGPPYNWDIYFDYISYEEAKLLYVKKNLNFSELKKLKDYMFHWTIKKSIERNLPVQIHTGYLHGNNSWLENGKPMKLVPLFIRYPKARFVIFHGSYPWTSEFVALGKSFSNVYLDIVWLPQISRTVAIRTLHEILDCVPYNKICWGGDVRTIEESAGSLELAKEVVATVLTERIEKGWLSEDVAYEIARKIFRENAIEIYQLDIKRNILK